MAMQYWRMHRKTKHRSTTTCGSATHPSFSKRTPSPDSSDGPPPAPAMCGGPPLHPCRFNLVPHPHIGN